MPKQKIGKDVVGKKGSGILQTKKEREDYEEWKRRKAEEQEEDEKQKQKKKLKPILKSKMPDEREPTPEELEKQKAEVTAGIRRLKVKKVVLKEEEE